MVAGITVTKASVFTNSSNCKLSKSGIAKGISCTAPFTDDVC